MSTLSHSLLLALALLLAAPAALAQQRAAAPTERTPVIPRAAETDDDRARFDADRARFEAARALRAERQVRRRARHARYTMDPTTGVPTLTPEAAQSFFQRHAEARRAAQAAAARVPERTGRRTASPPPPSSQSQGGPAFTVNSAWDADDLNPGDGVCDTGFDVSTPPPFVLTFDECTLRAAIEEANATAGTDPVLIDFGIFAGPAGSEISRGVWRVQPNEPRDRLGPLPQIERSDVTVDALTQPEASCGDLSNSSVGAARHSLKVVLDGSLLTIPAPGLAGSGNHENITMRGFVVQNVPGQGIYVGGRGSVVECNYVGTSQTGASAAPNADGIYAFGLFTETGTVRNNLVSGNDDDGIIILRNDMVVDGNLVGTDEDGLVALGNGGDGIVIAGDSVTVSDNVVSANGGDGVVLGLVPFGLSNFIADAAVLTDNVIGLSLFGTPLSGLGNAGDGVSIEAGADDNDIGLPGAGNRISHNQAAGVAISGTTTNGNHLRANGIGTSAPGTSAPNSQGVVIDGGNGNTVGGIGAGDGNTIVDNTNEGVLIDASDTDVIGNRIGIDAFNVAQPNLTGILVSSNGSLSDIRLLDNTISGNTDDGILITSPLSGATYSGFVIADNRIGTTDSGLAARGNGDDGLQVYAPTTSGTNLIENNVVSGNAEDGIDLFTSGFTVRSNMVGLGADGATPLGNAETGILVRSDAFALATGIVIGEDGAGNVASANGGVGILLDGANYGGAPIPNAVIEANVVGLDATGTAARSNGLSGIALVGTDGGVLRDNKSSANADAGLYLEAVTDLDVSSSVFGTDGAGALALGNGLAGLYCQSATDVDFGDTDFSGPLLGNTLAFNGGDGAFLLPGCQDVELRGNAIYDNAGLGIDLAPDGINPNDPGDGDTGANRRTNAPVITAVTSGTTSDVLVSYEIEVEPSLNQVIEFYRSDAPDPSNFGEGAVLLGTIAIGVGPSGFFSGSFPLDGVSGGDWISAVATYTDLTSRGSSEFSNAVQYVAPGGDPFTVTITPTNPTPPVVLTRGQRVFFDITFAVGPTGPASFQYWTEADLPNGSTRSPLIGPNTVTVTPPETITLSFSQRVPGNAPFGSYDYRVEAGAAFPNPSLGSDSFAAQVVSNARAAAASGEPASDEWLAYDAEGRLIEAGLVHNFVRDDAALADAPQASARVGVPETWALHAGYPNPFNPSTTLRFDVPESTEVRLSVYDALGREVSVLVAGQLEAGSHTAKFDAGALPSGVYLVRMTADAFARTQRLTLVR